MVSLVYGFVNQSRTVVGHGESADIFTIPQKELWGSKCDPKYPLFTSPEKANAYLEKLQIRDKWEGRDLKLVQFILED